MARKMALSSASVRYYGWVITMVLFGLGIATIVSAYLIIFSAPTSLENESEKIIQKLLETTPIIDGHNDLPHTLHDLLLKNESYLYDLKKDLTKVPSWASLPSSHTDIPRLRRGGVGGQFWSAYVDCKFQYKNALAATMKQIDLIKRMIAAYPDDFEFVTTADGIEKAFKNKKIGGLIGVEGGHSIDSSIEVLRLFYELGVRYLTLTHNCNTPWVDSVNANDKLEFDGLSPFGELVVKEMNRLGMLVDISHVAFATMQDVLRISVAPVIFSHSSAYAICQHNRNVPDVVLRQIAANGGIVMVNFYSDFVSCSNVSTLEDVADHIDHIRKVAGEDHVGLGADYNGVENLPKGLEDVSKYPDLLAHLLLRGWSETALRKLAGLNILRVLRGVENVRDKLASQGMTPIGAFISFDEIAKRSSCSLKF